MGSQEAGAARRRPCDRNQCPADSILCRPMHRCVSVSVTNGAPYVPQCTLKFESRGFQPSPHLAEAGRRRPLGAAAESREAHRDREAAPHRVEEGVGAARRAAGPRPMVPRLEAGRLAACLGHPWVPNEPAVQRGTQSE
jgi:hypothetical protein